MRRRHPSCVPLMLALLWGAMSGCGSTPHQNAGHPGYGEAEYKSDLSQCRRENSKIVMSEGYDTKSDVQVDAAKAQACMAAHGWRP